MMKKSEFERVFRAEILPDLIRAERGRVDRPMRREAWNDAIDSFIRDGLLPLRAGDWLHPAWLEKAPRTRRNARKNPLVGGETPIVGVSRAGSGWAVVGPGVNIPVKTKSDAESIVREIKSYGRYAGRDWMGEKINGFLVGGRYGYYAVDEIERGDNPRPGNIARTVASGITRRAATELARVLNETLT